jgi:hypothetical protein
MGLGDTPRVLYGCENKGVAGKGIRKSMKTKGSGKQWRVTSDERGEFDGHTGAPETTG